MAKPVIGSNINQVDPETDTAVPKSIASDPTKFDTPSYVEDMEKDSAQTPAVYISPEENKRLRRKANRW